MSNVQVLLGQYNTIERKVNEVKNKQRDESYRLDVDRTSLLEKTQELKAKGIEIHSREELQTKIDELSTKLQSALDSAQRKLDQANTN